MAIVNFSLTIRHPIGGTQPPPCWLILCHFPSPWAAVVDSNKPLIVHRLHGCVNSYIGAFRRRPSHKSTAVVAVARQSPMPLHAPMHKAAAVATLTCTQQCPPRRRPNRDMPNKLGELTMNRCSHAPWNGKFEPRQRGNSSKTQRDCCRHLSSSIVTRAPWKSKSSLQSCELQGLARGHVHTHTRIDLERPAAQVTVRHRQGFVPGNSPARFPEDSTACRSKVADSSAG